MGIFYVRFQLKVTGISQLNLDSRGMNIVAKKIRNVYTFKFFVHIVYVF